MDGFSNLSLNNNDPRKRFIGKTDPFDVKSMLSSIDQGGHPTTGFNVSSMRNALLDDVTTDVDMKDLATLDTSTTRSAAASTTPSDVSMQDLDVMDVEMADASGVFDHTLEDVTSGELMKKSMLRATTNTLFSPTAKGAEMAFKSLPGTPKQSPKKPSAKISSIRTAGPPASPTSGKEPKSMALARVYPPIELNSTPKPTLGATTSTTSTNTPNTHYHQHHYEVNLPSPWQSSTTTDVPQDTTTQTNNRLYTISSYLQILSNAAFASFVGYCLLRVVQIFSADVSAKKAKYVSLAISESQRCAREYIRNDCRLDARAPLMEDQCNKWEACMDADPEFAVGTLQLYAEVLGEIINTFIETFTARSIFVALGLTALVLAIIYFSNFAFGYWRAKLYYNNPPMEHKNTLKLD